MAAITLERLDKSFPNGHHAVRAVDLAVARGEFLVLVGPSGCGKSTLLRLIAGLELPTSGRILIGDRDVTTAPPQARDLAMVFQSYALYPHMSVRDNLSYGLRVRGTAAGDIAARVDAAAEALELTPLLDRRPAQLSGGQRQRVALGRAMVREPNAFLFDEPLSNLDPALRLQARAELLRLHRRLGTTMVYVTHDQEEAMTLAGRVAVMRDGRIEQVAPPMKLYERPENVFVAQFIGAPAMNLLRAPVPGVEAPDGTVVGVRPQDVVMDGGGAVEAQVDLVEPRGHDVLVHLRPEGSFAEQMLMVAAAGAAPAVQSRVRLGWRPGAMHLFEPATGRRLG